MSSTCDVCRAQPSKYKCPNCTVKYCSLACFKSHKPAHDSNDDPSSTATATNTATAVATEEPQTTSTAPAAPPTTAAAPATAPAADEDTALTALLASPALHHLLRKHPSLRPTLRSIYASTVEPDPDDWADRQRRAAQQRQRSFNANNSNFRGSRGGRGGGGRGGGNRGRGRGGGRGGAAAPPEGEGWGGWVGLDGQKARGPWRQEAADRFAVERLVRAQQQERAGGGGGGDEGAEAMREFVALVTAAVAEAGEHGGRMDVDGGD